MLLGFFHFQQEVSRLFLAVPLVGVGMFLGMPLLPSLISCFPLTAEGPGLWQQWLDDPGTLASQCHGSWKPLARGGVLLEDMKHRHWGQKAIRCLLIPAEHVPSAWGEMRETTMMSRRQNRKEMLQLPYIILHWV